MNLTRKYHRLLLILLAVLIAALLSSILILGIRWAIVDVAQTELYKQAALRLNNETRIAALDLIQQITIARYSFYQLLLAVAGAGVAIAGTIGLLFSLYQTRQAIKDNRKFGIAQTCAYLHAAAVEQSTIDGYILKIVNKGNSPALDVALTFYTQPAVPPLKDQYLFPDDNVCNLGGIPAESERPFKIHAPVQELLTEIGNGNLIISGSIKYSDVFGERYKSEFVFFKSNICDDKFLVPATAVAIHRPIRYF